MTDPLEQLAHQFNQWRQTRTKRSATPEHLRQAAAALIDSYTANTITKRLGICLTSFNRWCEQYGTHTPFVSLPVCFEQQNLVPPAEPDSLRLQFFKGTDFTLTGSAYSLAAFVTYLQA